MNFFPFAVILTACVSPLFGQTKLIHGKSGACQIAIPADWSVNPQTGWIASAPADKGDIQLISQPGRTVKPLSDMAQKALLVDKMISNTPQSVFYSNAPTKSANPLTPYRAVAPGKDGTCVAMFTARAGLSEEAVKKMVATLSASH
jgi:hypothetical protein